MFKNKKIRIILICTLAICVMCGTAFAASLSETAGNAIRTIPIDLNTAILVGIIILLLRQLVKYVVLIVVLTNAVLRK